MLKKIVFSVITVILFFALAEGVSGLFVFPGSYDYIERRAMEQGLRRHKGKDEFRIFFFGESTMFGGALHPHSTIDKWVRLYLADLLPEAAYNRVTTTNFARLGSGSRFASTAFIELLPYKPDLAVFYTAHNDFIQVEHRRALLYKKSAAKQRKEFFESLPKKSAFLSLINRLVIRWKLARSNAALAKSKKIDRWYDETGMGGVLYKDDVNLLRPRSPQYEVVKDRFEKNINRAIDAGQRNSVPIIFFEGVSKWKDYEPVRSMHGQSIAADDLDKWAKTFTRAENNFQAGRYEEALASYTGALEIDRDYALTYYRMGQCYEALGKHKEADEYYSLSNDNDNFPIRAPSGVNRIYEEIRLAELPNIHVIRTQDLFEENSENGAIDTDLVIDQIHPSIEGQAMMALEIVKLIYEHSPLAPKREWRWDRLEPIKGMEKKLGLDEDAKFDICLGSAHYVTNLYKKAAEFLEEAVRIKPKSIFARSWLAWSYWKDGDIVKALSLYRQLSIEAPDVTSKFLARHPEIALKMVID